MHQASANSRALVIKQKPFLHCAHCVQTLSKLLVPVRPCGGVATGVKDGDQGQWHPKPTAPKKSLHTRRPKHPAGALVIYMHYVFTSVHINVCMYNLIYLY